MENAQLTLTLESPQRGGRRAGAGRKRRTGANKRRDPRHRTRPAHPKRFPVHVTLRVREDVGRLRRGRVVAQLRRSLHVVAPRAAVFRVVHLSIQSNHLHLLVEAENARELTRGMQAFAISAARAINRAQRGRTGKVFAFRYHAREVTNRRQARHALAYVLNNWRRHREDWGSQRNLDEFSSAVVFEGWTTRFAVPRGHEPFAVMPAQTWLMRVGWKMYGLLDPREVPGPLG